MQDVSKEKKTDYGENYSSSEPLATRVNLHTEFSTNPMGWHQWMARELNPVKGMRVLELGCGTGELWSHVDEDTLSSIELFLTDSSDAMLNTCRHQYGGLANIEYSLLDLDSDFTIPENLDMVVANHVLYHSKHTLATLTRLKEQITPDTKWYFATNGRDSMKELSTFLPPRLEGGPMKHLIDNFTFESGLPVVKAVFGVAHLTQYEDSLRVTQVEPLMDYVRSLPWRLTTEELDIARHRMAEQLGNEGHIKISKNTGYISNANQETRHVSEDSIRRADKRIHHN